MCEPISFESGSHYVAVNPMHLIAVELSAEQPTVILYVVMQRWEVDFPDRQAARTFYWNALRKMSHALEAKR